MPPPANVRDFAALAVRSRLVSENDVQRAMKALTPSGKDSQDVESLRRSLIAHKQLTDYQAALLMRGLADGFFLGPYRILELIAKGRMAGVYKASHESGQVVAIKVLPASKAKDAETLARFKREARLMTRLDHPNVVRSFHVGEGSGAHYLVLEYLDGDTLEEVLDKQKKLPPIEAVRVVHQAMLGLHHIHERGMIHRDLKPANLMLVDAAGDAADKAVKILDIGLGKAVFDEGAKSTVDDPSQLTTDGVLIGTPDYLAPEQARSARTADIRSDIYSLGCVLYHALMGQPPFPDKSVLNTVMRHATETPRPLSDFLTQVPDGLQNVLNWMLAKDPAQRYPTPDRAAQALNLFLRNTPPAMVPARPLPAYEKWLAVGTEPEATRAASVPGNIPIGRLEPTGRKPELAKLAEVRKPSTATAPTLNAAPAPMPANIDVELVSIPDPAIQSKRRDGEKRGLFELNLRDVIMLVAGGLLVVIAITAGWGINKLLRREPPPQPEQQQPVEPNVPSES